MEAPFNEGRNKSSRFPVYQISTYHFRPPGKSIYSHAPWRDERDDTYVPSAMSPYAASVGLEKAKDPQLQLNEEVCAKAEDFMLHWLEFIWARPLHEFVITYETALTYLDLKKAPGDDYDMTCSTKGRAIELHGPILRDRVYRILEGQGPDQVPCRFTLTLKSELRHRDKVKLNKTRVFMAGPLHHLVAANMLFATQNDYLMQTIGQHPITIGIQLPGPEFVRCLKDLGEFVNDGDVSGCDLRFNLRAARAIRNIRMRFLPEVYQSAVCYLYNTVYCGCAIFSGSLYRVYGNKSGWLNTGHDNSLMTWFMLCYGSLKMYPHLKPTRVFEARINGDDLIITMLKGEFQLLADELKKVNFVLEAIDWKARSPFSVEFLSHHLQHRYVSGFGTFVVAAGNLPKILSSMNWIKRSETLTYAESCVAHLLGLRLCLFPWQEEFEWADELLTRYLQKIAPTPFIQAAMHARLNERQIAVTHTKAENWFDFLPGVGPEVAEALNAVLNDHGYRSPHKIAYGEIRQEEAKEGQ